MNDLKEQIKKYSNIFFDDIVSYRRKIHKHPELAYEEFETAKLISKTLRDSGIEIDDTFGETAVIGIINGGKAGKTIGLRADIDALPINELTRHEYKSQVKGVMHACGHDAHTASLLGTAKILNQIKHNIKGRIILIFQHAEEKNPGGAIQLIQKGLLEKYKISKMIGQHVMPQTKTGVFLFGSGKLMASTDELHISFNGKGGHAALPKERSDTVLALIEFLHQANRIQQETKSDLPFIIAFGKLSANGAVNVIPDKASANGTMRTFDEELRKNIKTQLQIIADKCAKKYLCEANLDIRHGYPSLENNEELNNQLVIAAEQFIGKKNIGNLKIRMTAEDFAYYSKEVPSVFYRFGIMGNDKGQENLHTPKFDLDENALLQSSALMAWLSINILENA